MEAIGKGCRVSASGPESDRLLKPLTCRQERRADVPKQPHTV